MLEAGPGCEVKFVDAKGKLVGKCLLQPLLVQSFNGHAAVEARVLAKAGKTPRLHKKGGLPEGTAAARRPVAPCTGMAAHQSGSADLRLDGHQAGLGVEEAS